MLVKCLSAAALAVASVPAVPQAVVNYPAVERIQCNEGSGTGFRAGGHFISVTHVTENHDCKVGIVPVNNAPEEGRDFSVGYSSSYGYKIDCGGFKEGEPLYAVGYANGLPWQTLIRLVGTGKYAGNGMAILVGYPTVIPGMSGGIVMNAQGEAVGTINMFSVMFPISLSQELKGTSVCPS